MITKTVKLSENNYNWLCEVAGTAQAEEKRMVSIDDAVSKIRKRLTGKLSDLGGSWKMSDKESDELMRELRRDWKRWTKSA